MQFTDDTTNFTAKPPDILVGGIVGCPMAAIIGPLCCWLVGDDHYLIAGLIGAILGTAIGLGFGVMHLRRRRNLTDTNLGLYLCTSLPLVLMAMLIGGGGKVGLGAAFAGPMTGVLIGSIVDRVYEAYLVRRASVQNNVE